MSEPIRYSEVSLPAAKLNDAADGLAPADASDPLLDAIKLGVDRTPLRCNLALTQEERVQKYLSFVRLANELRAAGEGARRESGVGLEVKQQSMPEK